MGLQVLEPGWITARQIEAGRIAMTRAVKRGGKIWIRIFPDKPYTKKPAETRMGKGKGAPEGWVAVVKPGRMLYEMEGVDFATGKEALELAADKLGLKTRLVTRAVGGGDPMKKKERETLAQQGHGDLAREGKATEGSGVEAAAAEVHRAAREPEPPADRCGATSRASKRTGGPWS